MAADLLASAAALLALPKQADVKYLGFVHVSPTAAPAALAPFTPGMSEVMEVNAMFDKKNIKKTRKMHPLFARGVPGLLTFEITAKSVRVVTMAQPRSGRKEEAADSLILDTPLHKVSFTASLKNKLFVMAKRTGIDKFICFVFETKNEAVARDLTKDLQTLSQHEVRRHSHSRHGDSSGKSSRPHSTIDLDGEEVEYGFESLKPPNSYFSLPSSMTNSTANSPLPEKRGLGSGTLSSWGSFESLSDLNPCMRSLSTHSLASISSVSSTVSAIHESYDAPQLAESGSCFLCDSEEESTEWVRLPLCGHEFHAPCIREYRIINNLCPVCKNLCSENLFSVKYVGAQFLHSLSPSESFSDVRTTCALTEQRSRHKRDVKLLLGRSDHMYLRFDSEPVDVHEEEEVLPRVCFTKPLHELYRFDRTGPTSFALTFRASQVSKSNGYLVQAFEVCSEDDMSAIFDQLRTFLISNGAWWCTLGTESGDEPGAPDE